MSENKSLFKPGQSGNPAGRPKGVRNKLTTAYKEKIFELIKDLEDNHIKNDIKKLSASQRVRLYVELKKLTVDKQKIKEIISPESGHRKLIIERQRMEQRTDTLELPEHGE